MYNCTLYMYISSIHVYVESVVTSIKVREISVLACVHLSLIGSLSFWKTGSACNFTWLRVTM